MSRDRISEEKARKIAVGAVVAGVLLILFLLIILIVLFVQIAVKRDELKELEEQTATYRELIEEGEDNLDWYKTRDGLYYTARQYGWNNK